MTVNQTINREELEELRELVRVQGEYLINLTKLLGENTEIVRTSCNDQCHNELYDCQIKGEKTPSQCQTDFWNCQNKCFEI